MKPSLFQVQISKNFEPPLVLGGASIVAPKPLPRLFLDPKYSAITGIWPYGEIVEVLSIRLNLENDFIFTII